MTGAKFSARQMEALGASPCAVTIYEGAIRSGKTFVWLLKKLAAIAEIEKPRGRVVIVGRSLYTVWRNVFEPIFEDEAFFGFRSHVKYKLGENTAVIFGRTVHVIGAADKKAAPRIQGMTVELAFVDELSLVPREFFEQLLGRMSVDGAQLIATTNPDSPAHWLKGYLDKVGKVDDQGEPLLPGWAKFRFLMDDNPSLSEDYKRRKKAEFSGLFYKRFVLGEWVAAEGAIYDTWDPEHHVIKYDELPPLSTLVSIGMDYGTTHATAALLLGMTAEKEPRLVFVDEWRVEVEDAAARWTDAQLSSGFKAWYQSIRAEHGLEPPGWIFLDHAAASLRVQLEQDGVHVLSAEKDVQYGIGLFSSLLGSKRLLITDRCAGLIKEIPSYAWDPRAALLGEEKPIKVADDSLDAARYAIASSDRWWRQYINPSD